MISYSSENNPHFFWDTHIGPHTTYETGLYAVFEKISESLGEIKRCLKLETSEYEDFLTRRRDILQKMQAVLKRYMEWDEATCDAHVQKDSSPPDSGQDGLWSSSELYYLMPEFQSECDSLAVMVNCRKVMTSNFGQVLTEEQKLVQEMQTVLKRLKGKYYPSLHQTHFDSKTLKRSAKAWGRLRDAWS